MITEIVLFILLYFSSYDATVTAYSSATVDSRWGGVARWTNQPPVVGHTAACPVAWKEQWVYVEDYGWRRCDDTSATEWYGDSVHVDIFLGSHQEALNHGVQTLRVWKARLP